MIEIWGGGCLEHCDEPCLSLKGHSDFPTQR